MGLDTGIHSRGPAPAGFAFPPRKSRQLRLRHSNFHTSWKSESALVNSSAKKLWWTGFAVLAVLVPFNVSPEITRTLVLALIASIGAIGLNIVGGVAGQLSLGHAGFLGVGAFSAAWVTSNQGWSFWWSLPLGGVVAGLFGLLMAPIALRLRGLYLSVVTLGFVFVMQHVFRTAESITGGVSGNRVVTPVVGGVDLIRGGEVAGLTIGQNVPYYFLALFVTGVTVIATKNLLRSRTGRNFAAIRDHDIAAGVVGVNVFTTKMQAFVISSFIAGVAGALLGGFLRFVTFEQWDLLMSVQYLAMIVLGGLGSVSGAVLGAFFVITLPEIVDSFGGSLPFVSKDPGYGLTSERLSTIIYGVLVAGVMVVEPLGLFGLWNRIRNYFSFWPFRN